MENVVFKYSDFFEDDGGMVKIKADFLKLGDELIAEAKRVRKEVSSNMTFENAESLAKYEKMVEDMIAVNKQYAKSLSDLKKVESEYQAELKAVIQNNILAEKSKQELINTTKKEIQAEGELNKAIITEINVKKSQVALEEAQRRQREASEKSIKKERDAYGQLSFELNQLFRASANVGAEMFRLEEKGLKTSAQYSRLSSEFNVLAQRTQKVDGALKQIDGTLGRNQRKVGDYASGFNGLSNSINQITRELPAFTFSAQTGFLAISNNIPMLVDELTRLKVANQELVKKGEPVKSLFSQVTGALFSFNTLISVGVTLLSVYGKEISNWVSSLFGASEALSELNKNQKEFMASRIEGRKDAITDRAELEKYVRVMRNRNLEDIDRNIALQKIKSQFPRYVKDLTDEQLLHGNIKIELNEINRALTAQGILNKATSSNVKIQQRLVDLKEEKRLLIESIPGLQKRLEVDKELALNDPRQFAGLVSASENKLNSALKRRVSVDKDILKYEKAIASNSIIINKYKGIQIGLEYQLEKANKKRAESLRMQQIDNVDFESSDFELRKQILSNTIKTNEEIFASDKYTLEVRLDAQKLLVTQLLALAEMERRESLRVLTNKFNEEKNATIKDGDGKILGSKYTKNGLIELEKQFGFDKGVIQETFRQKEIDANKKGEQIMLLDTLQMQIDNLKYLQKHLSTRSELYKKYSRDISVIQNNINKIISQPKQLEINDKLQIAQDELKRLQVFNKKIEKELEGKDFSKMSKKQRQEAIKQIEDFEEKQTQIEKNADTQRKMNRVRSIEEEQTAFDKNTDEWKALETERQNILIDLENDAIKLRLQKQKDSLLSWKDFADDLNDIIGQILDRMIEVTQKRIETEERALDRQKTLIDEQRRRAEQGLANTLAFEQRALGEREAMLIKQQKKEQRLQKIKSLWTSYANYSEKDPETAIGKSLRDFAILESISASFKEGGITGIDGVKTNDKGITLGKRHNADGKGGNLAWHEKGEGFFNRKEVANMGEDNFYKIKSMAGAGLIDSNFFTTQRKSFVQTTTRLKTDPALITEMREVKKAIESKPVQNWDLSSVMDGVIETIETVVRKNNVERNIYKTKKPRI